MTATVTEQRVRGEIIATVSAADWKTTCLNCGSALGGSYCAECGQRAAPPHPTLRELGGEALAELSGWDGKVAETVRALITKPGKLTAEFLAGRRSRFVSPLRLYLTCSVIYFLIATSVPTDMQSSVTVNESLGGSKTVRTLVDAGTTPGLSDADRREISRVVDKAPRLIRPMVRRVSTDAKGFQSDIFASLPKALFALLPVFAGIVALFYRGRHYAEHLYFAFHLHAFVFVALSFSAIAKLTHSVPIRVSAGILVLLWLPIYAHLAFRRVYGESNGRTLAKEVGIGALYVAASVPAIFALALWVAAH